MRATGFLVDLAIAAILAGQAGATTYNPTTPQQFLGYTNGVTVDGVDYSAQHAGAGDTIVLPACTWTIDPAWVADPNNAILTPASGLTITGAGIGTSTVTGKMRSLMAASGTLALTDWTLDLATGDSLSIADPSVLCGVFLQDCSLTATRWRIQNAYRGGLVNACKLGAVRSLLTDCQAAVAGTGETPNNGDDLFSTKKHSSGTAYASQSLLTLIRPVVGNPGNKTNSANQCFTSHDGFGMALYQPTATITNTYGVMSAPDVSTTPLIIFGGSSTTSGTPVTQLVQCTTAVGHNTSGDIQCGTAGGRIEACQAKHIIVAGAPTLVYGNLVACDATSSDAISMAGASSIATNNRVTITGSSGTSACISASAATCRIEDNTLSTTARGIAVTANAPTIKRNSITGVSATQAGIYCNVGAFASATIEDNYVTGFIAASQYGIVAYPRTTGGTITIGGNIVVNCKRYIGVDQTLATSITTTVKIRDNVCADPNAVIEYSLDLRKGTGCTYTMANTSTGRNIFPVGSSKNDSGSNYPATNTYDALKAAVLTGAQAPNDLGFLDVTGQDPTCWTALLVYQGTYPNLGTYPAVGNVVSGTIYGRPPAGNEYTGTFIVPLQTAVVTTTSYGAGGTQYTGTFAVPDPNYVLGIQFGAGGTQYTGTGTSPDPNAVISGTQYGAAGTQYTGVFVPYYPMSGWW